ncbi:CCA tRNA nucleotidyltransferase, mitochondrial [Pleurotus pulmonarius]|nr:CCA tRNA nucleotidyltransferase, mitochondrial [Pleurotus pulmonarius]
MSLLSRTSYPVKPPEHLQVILTDIEEQICVLVDGCTKHLKNEEGIETTCRIAGGWVRDKLLGAESNDIDIALSDMMGEPFAEHLVNFARTQGVVASEVAKIEKNPDQSKHLETATFRILDRSIDVVNLRSEEYTGDSRIPNQVTFGTPLQDALRRDITINALFYNIHTRSVEDFTEKARPYWGIHDLKHGIVRTPLPPRETFLDDPLRVIRCVRFASRFDFAMEPELETAVKDPLIQAALRTKVSRERVGEELTKMVKGRNPRHAIQLLHDLSLFSSVFSVLPNEITSALSSSVRDDASGLKAAVLLDTLLHPPSTSSPRLPAVHPTMLSTSDEPACTARLFLAAALTPYRGISYSDKKKKPHPAVEAAIRESLKLGTQNHFLDGIPALFAAAEMLRLPRLDDDRFAVPSDRVAIGLRLRDKAVHNPNTGSHWTSSLLFSLVQDLLPHYDIENDNLDVDRSSAIIAIYNCFVDRVLELKLQDAVDARPILDGREVSAALGAQRAGPWLGQVLAQVVEWQLGHPHQTKDDCIAWLRTQQSEGRVKINQPSEPVTKKLRTK